MVGKNKLILAAVFLGTILPVAALAHSPRLVSGDTTAVQNPEISQVFFSQLKSHGQYFKISSGREFNLYVNLLAPDITGVKTGITAEVMKVGERGREVIGVLDGTNFAWTKFYEPFGGDYYLRGPEFSTVAPAGNYLIHVYSHDYSEKYALAIGEKEKWTPGEIIKTLILLPQIKKNFFGRSPLTAYFNYSGLFLLGFLIALALVVFLVFSFWRRGR